MASTSTRAMAERRLQQLRTEMRKRQLDAYVIAHLPSLRYLLGFSGSSGMALVTQRKIHFFTNDLYEVQVRTELHALAGLHIHINRDHWSEIKDKGLASSLKMIGFDPTRHSVAAFKSMKKALAPAKLVEAATIVEFITREKSASEIKSIAKAAEIASTAYEKLLGTVSPGMTELQVATFLANTTRSLGSERDAFDIICVAGTRSAMPHGRASNSKIKSGDVVTVDFGCTVDGLHSDMTRVFCVGTPRKKVIDVFAVLYEAHMAALDAAVAGVSAADLDAAARSVIERAGFGEYFRHSLGHGLGYEVHEWPRVSHVNKKETIPANTVVTIEPGIYLPGSFGMRIEDDVVVTPKGARILTTAPRELVIV